jgi:hypothetical protein
MPEDLPRFACDPKYARRSSPRTATKIVGAILNPVPIIHWVQRFGGTLEDCAMSSSVSKERCLLVI